MLNGDRIQVGADFATIVDFLAEAQTGSPVITTQTPHGGQLALVRAHIVSVHPEYGHGTTEH
jgi:hypothetical protein